MRHDLEGLWQGTHAIEAQLERLALLADYDLQQGRFPAHAQAIRDAGHVLVRLVTADTLRRLAVAQLLTPDQWRGCLLWAEGGEA